MRLLKDWGNIKKNNFDDFIEHEDNLIHKGACLVVCVYSVNASMRRDVFFRCCGL